MPIQCSVIDTDIIFDLSNNSVKWCCKQLYGTTIDAWNPTEYFNDPVLTSVKEAFARDEKHGICRVCWDTENNGIPSWRQKYGLTDPRTNKDGRHVERLEIKLDNTCDLACIYCGPWFSTSWQRENATTGFYPSGKAVTTTHSLRKVMDTMEEIGRYSRCLHVAISGGEPFLSRHMTRENIESLISAYKRHNSNESSLTIKFNTNANTPANTLDKVISHLLHIKNSYQNITIHIALSLESVGKFTEFSRFLSDWNTVDENINRWLSNDWIVPMISTAFNALTLPNLPEFIDYAIDTFRYHHVPLRISPNIVYRPAGLTPSVLPDTFRKYVDIAYGRLEGREDVFADDAAQGYHRTMEALDGLRKTIGQTVDDKHMLKSVTDYCIQQRGIDLQDINPELFSYLYGSSPGN